MYLPAVQPFKFELSWLRAQAFRWTKPKNDGWFYGVVHDSLIKVRQHGEGIEFHSDASDEALKPHVINYFRLDQNISIVHDALRETDNTIAPLIEKFGGMRILRQDPWTCLVAYICSQQNDIDGITEIVERLARQYGTPLSLDGVKRHAFPSPRRLAAAGPELLEEAAPGLERGRRIHTVATDIAAGDLDMTTLARMPHAQVRAVLMSYGGIGDKIADCVCLFAFDKQEAFPVDRHIEEALGQYDQRYTSGAPNAGLMRWVRRTFGEHAGYAGQLLFLDQVARKDTPSS